MEGRAAGEWITGLALDDSSLAQEVLRRWQLACPPAGGHRGPPRDLATATALLEEAGEAAVAALRSPGDGHLTPEVLADIGRTQVALERFAGRVRLDRLQQAHAAVDELRRAASLVSLMNRAAHALCGCGYDRVMISQVDGDAVIPRIIHIPADPRWENELQLFAAGQRLSLQELIAEARIVRHAEPVLVSHAEAIPTLLRATEARSYVAAPITFQGVVIGFLHADCLLTRRLLETFDRDLVGVFATGVGHAWEQVSLHERLQGLRRDVRRGHTAALAVLHDSSHAGVVMDAGRSGDRALMNLAATMPVLSDAELLTRRERDVMQLLAAGETNAGIARILVLSEGTVKSHVKHILRKLRARNRAEAVMRFAALTGESP